MNKLMAAACVAVIVASSAVVGGAYVWWSDRQAKIAAEDRRKENEKWAREAAQRTRCEAMVTAWDGGHQAGVMAEYGQNSEQLVSNCRWLFDLQSP